ncbi:MAG TPA: MFS transporter [Candidatus Eisenbacteria bacterium]
MTLPLARHWRNVGWILSVEVFWGVSLALISMVAILPVFLTQLGASNAVIGVLPVIWILSNAIPGVFAAHLTGRLTHRKRAVILLHVVAAIPWLFLAAYFGLFGPHHAETAILVFLLAWGGAWVWMGLTIPVWINFIGKVTRPELRARSFGTIFFFQTLMGAIGGWVGSRVIGGGLAFPANYALGFFVAAICMAAGALFFVPVAEEEGAVSEPGPALSTIRRHTREILSDRGGIRIYLGALILSTGSYLLATYYPIYAQARFGLKARESALFTAVCMGGSMLGSVLTGVVGDRFGYTKVAVIALAALTAGLGFAVWGTSTAFYYATAFALGVFIVADRLALYNLSMAFSPHEDNTAYLGIIPALVAPITAVVAGSSGAFIDRFGFHPVALAGLAAAIVALYLVVSRLKEPRFSHAGKRAAADYL